MISARKVTEEHRKAHKAIGKLLRKARKAGYVQGPLEEDAELHLKLSVIQDY